MLPKVTLEKLEEHLPAKIDLFLCTASFEARCLSIAVRAASRIDRAVIIRNREFVSSSENHYQSLKNLLPGRVSEALVSSVSATVTADVFSKEVISRIDGVRGGNVFVDITTFTHEHLLILMALIKSHELKCQIQFGYTGAEEYSTNTDEEHVWLSRGVRQVRSILGYPGNLAPSKRLHLIVLVGFESERARKVIEIMEPSKLSLGIGDAENSVSPHHFSRNERFFARLRSFLETQAQTQTEVETFSFSCIDPVDARNAVLQQSQKHSDFNTVVCPMNTKISTVGVGLAALRNQRLQLIYASPEEYNEMGYSTPARDARLFGVDLR